jgi:alpha-tubulin suppressor-like RCC1 family protein
MLQKPHHQPSPSNSDATPGDTSPENTRSGGKISQLLASKKNAFITLVLLLGGAFLLTTCGGGGGGGSSGGGSPTTTVALTVTSVGTGDSHTCAALPDKTVKCWGDNSYGQLGTDWTLPRAYSPITVAGITNATAVSGGAAHTCALLADSTASCWGSNVSGQLGNGSTTDSFTPVKVSGLTNAIAITASRPRLDSYGHTCALISDGTVKCWGRNIVGQLGNGTTTDSSVPVTVSGLSNVIAIQAGGFHTCALLSDHTVQCWGDNALGQLGDIPTLTPRTTPFTVPGISTATALGLGGNFSCALLSNGSVQCWGDNSQGRLGNGTTTASYLPVTVSGISTAIALTVGRGHACAVLTGGTTQCWGDNSAAMLGNGTTISSTTPITVSGLSSVAALTAGAVHTCARLTDNTIQCWGDNANAQVGPGGTTYTPNPTAVRGFSASTTLANVSSATTGSQHSCGLLINGTVGCWGWNGSGQIGNANFARSSNTSFVSGIAGATALSAGGWHNCVRKSDNTVQCWGENTFGQLGDGTLTNSSTPVPVSGITAATDIATGSVRSCALLTGGTAQCWGDNDQGQLGNGAIVNSSVPVSVIGLSDQTTALAGGYNHACALLTGGAVQCWGANYSGQLGNGTLTNSSTPVGVSGLYTVTTSPTSCSCTPSPGHICTPCVPGTTTSYTGNAIALGKGGMNDHSCAVISDGTIKCWGDNTYGQLGNGTLTNASTPVLVSGISTATAVAVGYGHSCARLSDSTVKCWGWNVLGQLGNGTTTDSPVPVSVTGISDATTVTAGFAQSCASRSGGGVQCWGDNSYVQLGLGVLATSITTPAAISIVTRTTSKGRTFPSCLVSLLQTGPAMCVLDGNLVIRAGSFFFVIPMPPE